MPTGTDLLRCAEQHVGEIYRNILVPKDDPSWRGPWDCAEFASWVVYQVTHTLYGCDPGNSNPHTTEAYTGYWEDDARRRGTRVSQHEAAGTAGGIVLRYPPRPGSMGHIAFCDGRGGTVEARGRAFGVTRGRVDGRPWDTGLLIPGVEYQRGLIPVAPPTHVYAVGASGMDPAVVRRIQTALAKVQTGSDPDRFLSCGPVDGEYGTQTEAAVAAFQAIAGLVVDGQVGPETAGALGIDLGRPTVDGSGATPADKTASPTFTINTNLKTTTSPLDAEKIHRFFAHQTDGRDALKDIGEAVENASRKYGINATYIVAHAILESGWGRSQIARTKHNLYGWAAIDEDPSQAKAFGSNAECIDFVMGRINQLYLTPGGRYYDTAPCLGNKHYGMNKNYAAEADWGADIAKIAGRLEREA